MFGEKRQMKVAWWMPRWLAMWCFIRVVAHATTGEFGNTNPNDLNVMEALRRWDDPRGGDCTLHTDTAFATQL